MKKRFFVIIIALMLLAEAAALVVFGLRPVSERQDAVSINAAVHSVTEDFNNLSKHKNESGLDYVVIDVQGNVLYKTQEGLSESMNAAITHRDTVINVTVNGAVVGSVIFYNDQDEILARHKYLTVALIGAILAVQTALLIAYIFYIDRTVIKPFGKMKGFAERVASGNLDIPLEMDKHNRFGAFTESFDIMRSELKKSRIAEAKANESKKELVAKLSHDIKTPVASIKAASEVGLALTKDVKVKEIYGNIIAKTDQINALVSNLFSATLEELEQLSVEPNDVESSRIKQLIENADYLHKANISDIPDALVYADILRLQQVFDNIIANSYKYAGTEINVEASETAEGLVISIEDFGGGVEISELPLIVEKYKRGSNSEGKDGAGLGLYISQYFMRQMGGELTVENGEKGLKVNVTVRFAGKN